MAIEVETKQWGNSVGVIIPREVINGLKIKVGESVLMEIEKKENPLKSLFGFGKGKKILRKSFLENRRMLESKYV